MGGILSKEIPIVSEDPTPEKAFPLGELPSDVLERVLKNLDVPLSTLLGYRSVNHQWKEAVTSILEEKVLCRDLKMFPIVTSLSSSLKLKPTSKVAFPLAIHIMSEIGNPFPSNSLILKGKPPKGDKRKRTDDTPADSPPGILVEELFGSFGKFLTTFSLQNLSLSLGTLVKTLGTLPNLKFLKISDISLTDYLNKMMGKYSYLPPLSQLKILEMEFTNFATKPLDERRKLRILQAWLVSKYATQLEILVMNGGVQLPQLRQDYLDHEPKFILEHDVICYLPGGAFGNLKELAVYRPCRKFLQLKFSALEVLSVEGLDGGKHVDIFDVAGIIEDAGETITHAHLDISWAELLEKECFLKDVNGKELGKEFKLESVRDEAILNLGKLRIFGEKKTEKLKRLALQVPKDDVEAAVIKKNFLENMEGLRKLEFIQFEKVAGKKAVEPEGSGKEKKGEGFIKREDYWRVCEKLKVVSVSSGPKPNGDVYEEHRNILEA